MNENMLINQLPNSLPKGLSLEGLVAPSAGAGQPDFQGVLKIEEKEFPVAIEVKNTGGTATFREAARQIKTYAAQSGVVPFVAGQFFGESARQVAKEEGVGIMDLAGNFYLKQNNVYIEKIIDKNPFTQKVLLKNLFAPVSSRITRVLLTHPTKTWLLGDLSKEAKVSLGQTHKIMERMMEEELVARNQDNRLAVKNPTKILEAWKSVYPSYAQQKFTFFSYEKDYMSILSSLLKKPESNKLSYALSFFSGAHLVAPFLHGITKLQLYVPQLSDIAKWRDMLELKEVESGGNVELYIPYDEGVSYENQRITFTTQGKYGDENNDIPVVSNIQLYMDLFHNPARGAEQAEHLREKRLNF